jgi:hypothetical protein
VYLPMSPLASVTSDVCTLVEKANLPGITLLRPETRGGERFSSRGIGAWGSVLVRRGREHRKSYAIFGDGGD